MAKPSAHPRRRRFIKFTTTALVVAPFANALLSEGTERLTVDQRKSLLRVRAQGETIKAAYGKWIWPELGPDALAVSVFNTQRAFCIFFDDIARREHETIVDAEGKWRKLEGRFDPEKMLWHDPPRDDEPQEKEEAPNP